MNARLLSSLCFACVLLLGATLRAVPPVRVDDPAEGQKLAKELRSVFPTEEIKFSGILRLTASGKEPREVPIESRVVISGDSWRSIYKAKTANGVTEILSIRHFADRPSEYEWQRGDATVKLSGAMATNSFAGSDFALLDLGLEFYHWPTQILAMREMRKGRGCDVLESRPTKTNLYSRVLSWIDQESRAQGQPGLLMAEAYGADGRLLKEFEIKGFKKVAGRWQVREMEIRNVRDKTSTRLQFEFDEK